MPVFRYNTGVYIIENLVNGKVYVGSASKSLPKRLRDHKYQLGKNCHFNNHLQAAWNRYGAEQFKFRVLQRCSPQDCLSNEQNWIDHYQCYDSAKGYNKSPTAGSPLGVKHTIETRKKLSLMKKGIKKSPEAAAAIRRGKQNISEETKRRISVAHKAMWAAKSREEKLEVGRKLQLARRKYELKRKAERDKSS